MRELDTRFNVQDDTWRPYITALEEGEDGLLAASLFRQETAAHGLLLASGFNLCLRHDDKVVLAETKDRLENIIKELEDDK